MMKKVFVDTDIIIDLLAMREPHYQFSARLFSITTLLTRNLKDYKKANISVLTAEQYLKSL
jgi:hypothetical protein